MDLKAHPRLYIDGKACGETSLPLLEAAREKVVADAGTWRDAPPLEYARNVHNAHLIRARLNQTRVLTLIERFQATGDRAFRDAALAYVKRMDTWPEWSWIAWRDGDRARDAIYDLSYGENSATLALAYDLLHDVMSPAERKSLVRIARRWSMASADRHLLTGEAWWFRHPHSNWNTVCAGGLGMLLLAMWDELGAPEALLAKVEESFEPYFATLAEYDGAWPEGIGYWNYGMRYAFMYLLSWQRATGRAHPLMSAPGVARTMEFPLLFCPYRQPSSFSDVNRWAPLPFHYAAARALGLPQVCRALEAESELGEQAWPNAAEWLLLHPGRETRSAARARAPLCRLFKGLDWGVLADRWPEPNLFMSIRGGTTEVPHGHLDLLSYHVVAGRERLIASIGPAGYHDTTFSSRRYELMEMVPQTKNTILINGVGVAAPSKLDSTRTVKGPGMVGLRLEATTAMGVSRSGVRTADFCGRLALLVDGRALAIVDRVELPFVGLVECRQHSYATVEAAETGAVIRGREAVLQVAYAADVPCAVGTARPALTEVTTQQPTMLRWGSRAQVQAATLVTVLAPGEAPARAEVEADGKALAVTVSAGDWSRQIRLSTRLRLVKA